MSYRLKKSKRTYRAFLTSEEERELEKIDLEIVVVDARRRELTRKRALVVNRAAFRARYQPAGGR